MSRIYEERQVKKSVGIGFKCDGCKSEFRRDDKLKEFTVIEEWPYDDSEVYYFHACSAKCYGSIIKREYEESIVPEYLIVDGMKGDMIKEMIDIFKNCID